MLLNCGVGEDSWESLGLKEIQPVHPKGYQSWIFIRRTDAEAETPILWLPYVKSWLTGKDPDTGEDWRPVEKGTTEDEMVGWHHRLNGTWVWVNSGSWWWTERPGVSQSMGLQRVGHGTELNSREHKLSVVHNPNAWSLCTRPCSTWSLPFSPLAHTSPAFISSNTPKLFIYCSSP